VARTNDELKAAVESMCRVRAVESPADAKGVRRVWHRGTRGAELITDIDPNGKVLFHEFVLFDEVLTWNRERGLGTGSARLSEAEERAVVADDSADLGKISRAARLLQSYTGSDRLLSHLRERVLAQSPATREEEAIPAPAPSAQHQSPVLWLIAAGLVIVAVGLYFLFR
jgi:hypothetical protein